MNWWKYIDSDKICKQCGTPSQVLVSSLHCMTKNCWSLESPYLLSNLIFVSSSIFDLETFMNAMQYEWPLLFLLYFYHHSFLIFNCVIYRIMLGFVSFIRDARSSALELSLQKLGIEKLTEDKMQHWVSSNVGTWTHIMHITVRMLLKLWLCCMCLYIKLINYA